MKKLLLDVNCANKQGNEVDLDIIAWLQNVATPQELSAQGTQL